jgi:hypothetical protein
MPPRLVGAILAGSAFLCAGALPADAIEPAAVADAIGAALVKGGKAQFGYDAATLDGDNVVIEGLTLSRTSSEESLRFEKTIVESPAEDDIGLFHSPRVTFTEGTAAGEPSGTIASATVTDVVVLDPAEVESEGFAEGVLYRTAEVTDVHLTRDSAPREVALQHATVTFGDRLDDGRQDISGTMEGFAVSPELFARGRFKPEALGYDTLVFDIAFEGTLDRTDGTVAISASTLTLREGGTLSITGTVGDLPDPRVLNDADVLARATQVELHDLVVRYEDDAFLGRLLDFLAGEQELTRAEYVEQLSAALPFLLAVLTHPDFRQQLIDALNAFLRDPQSLTIEIAPEPPISAKEVRKMARSSLGEVPDRLHASVSANSQE